MAKVPYGLELYSVRHDLAKDMRGTLKAVKEMGYVGVEFAGGYVNTAEDVKKALDDFGLVCCGWHTPWDYVQDDKIEATIKYNLTVGNQYVIIPSLPGDLTNSEEGWKKVAEQVNKISEKLKPHGLYTGYHNHGIEFKDFGGKTGWDIFFENTEKDVIMQLDTGNAMGGGADIYPIVEKFPGRGLSLHIKPYSEKDKYATMFGAENDSTNWKKFFSLADKFSGVKWYVVEYECETLYTPMDGVKRCIDALKKMESEGIIL